MNIRKIAAIGLLVLSSVAATTVAPSKSELESMYDKAFREFDGNNFAQALKELDAIDTRQPDLAESQNLRGVILMRQGNYDKAEAALRKALEIDSKFWNARFNLAEIPFLRKDWAEARNRFEALLGGNASELQPEATQLIQYKILLTYLLEGKENMIDGILNKFELSTDTPAVYYANAAVALHHKNTKEAKDWVTAAEKSFSSQLNKLFAESFYEVGWMEKPAGQTRAALELTSTAERAAKMKSEARTKFEQAERAFQQHDLGGALKFLDEADAADSNQAASYNLRGEILMEQKDFDQAEAAFKKAFKADPKFREAQYNLAQIPFKKKDYAKSRDRLEALFGETPGGEKNQAAQLIKFKIFMTLLLEGKDSRAQKIMDQFKFTGDTPALYYAQAAWEFKHNNPDKGNEWVASARKIYSPPLNIVFADSFYDLGWIENPAAAATSGTAVAASSAEPAPAKEPSPAITLAQASPVPALSLTESTSVTDTGTKLPAATLSPAPNLAIASAPLEPTTASVSPPPLIPGESIASSAVANNSPPAAASAAPSVTITSTAPSVAPAATLPVAAAEPAGSQASSSPPAVASPAVVANSSPATVSAPREIRAWAQPTFAETLDRLSDPHTLLVGALLLAGVVLLVWLLVQQVRRQVGAVPLYRPATPVTAPRFNEVEPVSPAETVTAVHRNQIAGGPPKLSLQLKASEPSVRRAALPVGISARSAASPAAVGQSAVDKPVESFKEPDRETDAESDYGVSEPIYHSEPPPIAQPSFRDDANVSLSDRGTEVETPEIAPASIVESWQPAPEIRADSIAVAPEAAAETVVETPPEIVESASREVTAATPPSEEVAAVEQHFETAVAGEVLAPSGETPEFAESHAGPALPVEEVVESVAEPVGQGQPIPYQTPVVATEIPMPEITPPTPQSPPAHPGAGLAGLGAVRPSVESPSFAPKAVSSHPVAQQPTQPATMPEPTSQIPSTSPLRSAAPMGGAAQPAAAMQTAVQLTFSLEIASLQLTPSFKMGSLQLKPTSKIVTMRLAPSQHPQPAMNLQVTFEIATVQLGTGGSIAAVRLTPSQQQKPGVLTTPAFEISGLQLVSSFESAPVQLTPSHQGQASVHMTASFNIATVEFSPSFEISSILLNSNSRSAAIQLPGTGPSSIEGAPIFEITNVQLTGNNEIGLIQLNPPGTAAKRA